MVGNGTLRRVARLASGSSGICSILITCAAFAQQAPETAFLEELPVVLSASRLPQSLADTPGAVTVIDRDLIRATGYRDISRLLRLVPGFTVAQSRGHAVHPSYHGLAAEFPNRMQVLIDGRSVYSPYFLGGTNWASLPITIDEIDRIEVLRGSNSATYGSNAFLGVVNIITRHSAQDRGSELTAARGNAQISDLGFRHGGQVGDLSFRVNAEYRYDQGFENLNDNWKGETLTFRGDYRLQANEELTLLAGVHHSGRGYGFPGNPVNSNGEREVAEETGFANVRWRRTLGMGSEISAGYYRNVERGREQWNVFLPPFFPIVPVDFDRYSIRDNADFQHNVSISPRLRIVWGAEARTDRLESARLFFVKQEESQSLLRLYGNGEWHALEPLVVNAGAMLERYSSKQAKLAPRVFANWHVAENHTLRAGWSRAFRAPSLFEERGDQRFFSIGGILLQQRFTPAGSLRPERIDAAELGYLGRIPQWNGIVDVRLYRERIVDFIDDHGVASALVPPPLLPPTFKFVNEPGTAWSRGLESHVRLRPRSDTDLLLGYALMRIEGLSKDLDRTVPRHSGAFTWIQRYPGGFGSTLTLYRVGAYKWGGGAAPVPGYTSYDLRASYKTNLAGRPAEVALVLLNYGPPHDEATFGDAVRPTILSRQAFFTVRLGF
ncbi:MAG: TonB-dependent receptor [Betaproteobacteria bacterium]|nr:TonB-dependent receptor [Betaproteobacteria bacterium]